MDRYNITGIYTEIDEEGFGIIGSVQKHPEGEWVKYSDMLDFLIDALTQAKEATQRRQF